MAWADVPTKLDQYDAEPYADNSNGTTASQKLIRSFTNGRDDIAFVPVAQRDEFEEQLDYRLGACINLRNSRGWNKAKMQAAR